jgi:hypothetical protein
MGPGKNLEVGGAESGEQYSGPEVIPPPSTPPVIVGLILPGGQVYAASEGDRFIVVEEHAPLHLKMLAQSRGQPFAPIVVYRAKP